MSLVFFAQSWVMNPLCLRAFLPWHVVFVPCSESGFAGEFNEASAGKGQVGGREGAGINCCYCSGMERSREFIAWAGGWGMLVEGQCSCQQGPWAESRERGHSW